MYYVLSYYIPSFGLSVLLGTKVNNNPEPSKFFAKKMRSRGQVFDLFSKKSDQGPVPMIFLCQVQLSLLINLQWLTLRRTDAQNGQTPRVKAKYNRKAHQIEKTNIGSG